MLAAAGCPEHTLDGALELLTSDVVRAAAGHVVVAEGADGVRVLSSARAAEGPAPSLRARLMDAARTPSGDGTIVATDTGLFFVDGDALVPSPVSAALPGPPDLVEACGAALYIGSGGRLFRYTEIDAPALHEVALEVTGFTSALCAEQDGAPLLMLVAQPQVVELDVSDDQLAPPARLLASVPGARGAARLADKVLVQTADLVSVDASGASTPLLPSALALSTGGGVVWAAAVGALVRSDGGSSLHPVRGAPSIAAATLIAGGAGTLFTMSDGSALLVREGGDLVRVHRGRAVLIEGVEPDALLAGAVTVTVTSSHPELTASLEVTLDGAPLEPTFTLDAATLSEGEHVLRAVASFTDGVIDVSAERAFRVDALPTWSSDVRALNDNVCSRCHSVQGGARLLDTSDRWRAEIDQIVAALESRLMPIDRALATRDIQVVRRWRETGMKE